MHTDIKGTLDRHNDRMQRHPAYVKSALDIDGWDAKTPGLC